MNRSNSGSSHFDLQSSRLRYCAQRSSSQRQPSADSSSLPTSSSGSSSQGGSMSDLISAPATSGCVFATPPYSLECAKIRLFIALTTNLYKKVARIGRTGGLGRVGRQGPRGFLDVRAW